MNFNNHTENFILKKTVFLFIAWLPLFLPPLRFYSEKIIRIFCLFFKFFWGFQFAPPKSKKFNKFEMFKIRNSFFHFFFFKLCSIMFWFNQPLNLYSCILELGRKIADFICHLKSDQNLLLKKLVIFFFATK